MINYSNNVKDVYNTTAKSGFPSPALDYLEESIDLNRELIDHPFATVFVEYTGIAMNRASIPSKAKLLVDKSLSPCNGDIVVARVGERFMVRFYRKENGKVELVPAHKSYAALEISKLRDVEIWGVVKYVITDAKYLKGCML